jgi:hypothetical protein
VRGDERASYCRGALGNLFRLRVRLPPDQIDKQEITQNDKSGLHGKCSSCDTYFTFGGPGLARNPEAAMRTMQRQFDKHFRQVHMREEPAKLLCGS